jgi:hypothetical protein
MRIHKRIEGMWITSCGVMVNKFNPCTADSSKVTCKKCLRILQASK